MTTDYPVDEALADAIRWAEAGAPYPPGARGWRPAIGVLAWLFDDRDRYRLRHVMNLSMPKASSESS